MKHSRILWPVFFLSIFLTIQTHAQMAGSPVGVRGQGEWSVSAEATYMDQAVSSEWAISRRLLLKSLWGVTPWLDLYIMGGGFQLSLDTDKAGYSDYKSKYAFAYGLGYNMAFDTGLSGVNIWFGGQALRAPSTGSFEDQFVVGDEIFTREYKMVYDWWEFQAHLGLIIPVRNFRFYIAGAGWLIHRFETKKEYIVSSSTTEYPSKKGEFDSGIWTAGLFGIELLLPKGYSITVEGLFFNVTNYHLMFGICQTGIGD